MVAQQNNTLPNFDIAIVNYKTLELTKICLDLLKQHFDSGKLDPKRVRVFVVDNDSQDASLDYLRSQGWINLIERHVTEPEEGFAAHGKALDIILGKTAAPYLFLMHTDTFIYDPSIFERMLHFCMVDQNVGAVGCLHQLDRGRFRLAWRYVSRFFKHHYRRLMRALGLPARDPKPYREDYIKSFFALWNVQWMKQHQLTFFMQNRIPGYALQDIMPAKGCRIKIVSPSWLFKYLDHVEAGTVAIRASYDEMNRRIKRKKSILQKFEA